MPLKLLVWSTTVLITCDLGQRCKVHSFQLPPVFQLPDNPSEETIFGSSKIKGETGEICSQTMKTLISELNRRGSAQVRNLSEKSYLYYSILNWQS